jgi:hypothetical protein
MDDLVSALRYAVMSRRKGKPLSECEGIGYGPMPLAGQNRDRIGQQQVNGGIGGVDWSLFTGEPM